MSMEKKKVSLEEYLDNVLAEISSKNLTAAEKRTIILGI